MRAQAHSPGKLPKSTYFAGGLRADHQRAMADPQFRSRPAAEVEADPEPFRLREVALSELNREASSVVRRVEGGELAVVSRHGRPVAMILPIATALAWAPSELTSTGKGRELGAEFQRRDDRRFWSASLHGRSWDRTDRLG